MARSKKDLKAHFEAQAGGHIGDLVYSEISNVNASGISRADVRTALEAQGLDADLLLPEQRTDRFCFGRAITYAKVEEPYFLSRPERRSQDVLLMRREGVGTATQDVTCCRLVLDEPAGAIKEERHPTEFGNGAQAALDEFYRAFEWHRDYLDHGEVSALVITALQSYFASVRLRRNGGLYWTPAVAADGVRAFARALETIGNCELTVLPVYDTAEARAGAGRGMARSFQAEIDGVVERLERFASSDRNTQERGVVSRLEELEEMRSRVALVEHVLEGHAARIRSAVDAAEAKAHEVLEGVRGKSSRFAAAAEGAT